MKMKLKRYVLRQRLMAVAVMRYAVAIALAPILLAGCSHKEQPAPTPAVQGGVKTGPPTVAGIQSDMDKINADPNMSAAQKQIMINEMQHAQASISKGK